MTDSLLAAAGLLSPSLAGQALVLDYLEEEQKRQMVGLIGLARRNDNQGR